MALVDRFEFNDGSIYQISQLKHWKINVGENWPVVYIINNQTEAYVGETINASLRASQHLMNPERRRLTEISIVSDNNFNKSVILDLEAFLIKHMDADKKYKLQNGNGGLRDHEYFNKVEYEEDFKRIWNSLRKIGLAEKSLEQIENSELYKYSPYKALGKEQILVEREILKELDKYGSKEKGVSILVKGGAGTGKTILGIYLMKMFADSISKGLEPEEAPDDYLENDPDTVSLAETLPGLQKIGIIIPQKSLRTSLRDVFKGIKNLSDKMVLSPDEMVKDYLKTGVPFDLLIVDESHRLKCRDKGHLQNYASFDRNNAALGFDKFEGTELDWILKCSRNQILFRDELQTVRPCDIDGKRFKEILETAHDAPIVDKELQTQWRCLGGNDYIDYLKEIFACTATEMRGILNYDFKLFENCKEMIDAIKAKDAEMGLCRNVAGYAWRWDRKNTEEKTINIQGEWYRWNRTMDNWIVRDGSIDEIGCIHTTQGYDLNYCGVIIGRDIRYDKTDNRIYAVKENYYDQQGKSGVANDLEGLTRYLCNIYLTLMTRGIKGCYVYVCDDELREYMKRFIPTYNN